MRFGIFTSATDSHGSTLDEVVAATSWAEAAGFDSAWVPHLPWSHDSLTTLAVVGREVDRIELGTAVVPTVPVHPMTTARTALSVHAAVGGRLALGIGPSHQSVIEGMYGLSYDAPAAHTREYVEVLRAAFDGAAPLEHHGERFDFTALFSVPEADPSRPPGLLVAALGPRMLRLAGELADGTILWFADEAALEHHVVPRLTGAAAAAGRPAPRVVSAMPIAVCDDAAAGREALGRLLAPYEHIPTYQRMLARGEAGSPAEVVLVGTERQVADRLRRWEELGVTEYLAAPIPIGDDAASREASRRRTRECVAALAAGGL